MTGRDHIQKAMRNHSIVYFIILLMTAFGIFALPNMNKDEFPQFTIRQGVVAAIYPGATAQEVEEQVTIPLENYLNGFEFIDKHNTYSISEDGIVYVYVMLRNSVESSNEAWNKRQRHQRRNTLLFRFRPLPLPSPTQTNREYARTRFRRCSQKEYRPR